MNPSGWQHSRRRRRWTVLAAAAAAFIAFTALTGVANSAVTPPTPPPVPTPVGTVSISGRVLVKATGSGVGGMCVRVARDGGDYEPVVATAADGTYRVNIVQKPGTTARYTLDASPTCGADYWYETTYYSVDWPEYSNTVTLTAPPASGTSAATLVDMYTRHGGRIVGKLTDSVTGKAIAGAEVSTDGQSQAAYVTNSDGSFILGGLMPGDYLVHVRAYDQKYVSPEFVPHQPTYSTAVSYSVADGQDTVVNETLLHADQIKGQVTDKATGLPAANVFVTAWPLSGPWIANSSAKTNAQGKFTLKGLGPGTYSVCFMDIGAPPPRFQSRCWRNQPRYSFYSGTPLTLYGFGTTRAGIDQALPRSN